MTRERNIQGTYQVRRDTTANWIINKNVIPASGEPCFDVNTKVFKIGDGITTYENLESISGGDDYDALLAEVNTLKEVIGTSGSSDSSLLSRMTGVETLAAANEPVIDSIMLGDSLLDIINKTVNIPVGAGLQASDEITIGVDGTLRVGAVNIDKITQTPNTRIVLSGGNSNSE